MALIKCKECGKCVKCKRAGCPCCKVWLDPEVRKKVETYIYGENSPERMYRHLKIMESIQRKIRFGSGD